MPDGMLTKHAMPINAGSWNFLAWTVACGRGDGLPMLMMSKMRHGLLLGCAKCGDRRQCELHRHEKQKQQGDQSRHGGGF